MARMFVVGWDDQHVCIINGLGVNPSGRKVTARSKESARLILEAYCEEVLGYPVSLRRDHGQFARNRSIAGDGSVKAMRRKEVRYKIRKKLFGASIIS